VIEFFGNGILTQYGTLVHFQFHPSLGITPLEQVQTLDYGNILVMQEKFDK
jgi:hypothetical protein